MCLLAAGSRFSLSLGCMAKDKRKEPYRLVAVYELKMTAAFVPVWSDVTKQPLWDPTELSPPKGDSLSLYSYTGINYALQNQIIMFEYKSNFKTCDTFFQNETDVKLKK